jgi:hypothetical protein
MLAIPRIQAVSDGVNSATRPKVADRSTSGTNTFIKVLSGLVGQKSTQGIVANSRSSIPGVVAQAANKPGKPSADPGQESVVHANVKTATALVKHDAMIVATSAKRNGSPISDGDASRTGKSQESKKQNRGSGDAGDAIASTAIASRSLVSGQVSVVWNAAETSGNRNGIGGKVLETIGTGTETRTDGTKVSVVDLRLKARLQAARQEPDADGGEGKGGKKSTSGEVTHPATVPDHGNIDAGERLGGGPGTTGTQAAESSPKAPATSHGSFAESLAARLRDGAADIVRSAQVVLRNGDVGLIRMRLEPETLGGVKIELKMAEKQISGRIIVESDIAGEAFRSSIDALKDAFAESGFDVRSLEVEVRNGMASEAGTDGRSADNGSSGSGDGPYWSRSLRELDAAVPTVSRSGRDGLLNVLV